MRRLIFSPQARTDLSELRAFISQDRPHAAASMARKLAAAAERLRDFPEVGRIARGSKRRELVTVRPYVIVYQVTPQTVRIERIIHGARRR